jgi:hypothetical protein
MHVGVASYQLFAHYPPYTWEGVAQLVGECQYLQAVQTLPQTLKYDSHASGNLLVKLR